MPTYKHFEDLPAWREAAALYNRVLDLLETPDLPLSSGYRNQLDRAALSVSNNVAEGFERISTGELLTFLGIARGSAGEVCSMIATVRQRPRLRELRRELEAISKHAHSCLRQITAWMASIEASPIQGKRHLTNAKRSAKETASAAQRFRLSFLQSLAPDHPLYNTDEARAARETSLES
jgi:four helix bundle protein